MTGSPKGASRRAFLRAGAGGAAGVLGATAGCLEFLPPLGERVRYGRVDAPAGGEPSYRAWIPAESALDDDLRLGSRSLLATTPASDGSDVVGAPLGFGGDLIAGRTDYFGIGLDHYDLAVSVGGSTALEGPVDPEPVRDTLLESGYERAGDYAEYALYDREDVPRTTAVADGRIVHSSGDQRQRNVEALIDAREGRIDRQHRLDDSLEAVTSRVGQRPFLFGSPGEFFDTGEAAHYGLAAMDYDESAVYSLAYTRYADGVEVPLDAIRSELQSQDSALLSTAVDVRADGQFAVVETRLSHEAFRSDLSEARTPHATWSVDEATDLLVLRHEAGESVPADELRLLADRDEPLDRQFADEHDVVTDGTELSVRRPELGASPLVLEWNDPDGDSSATLLRYEHQ